MPKPTKNPCCEGRGPASNCLECKRLVKQLMLVHDDEIAKSFAAMWEVLCLIKRYELGSPSIRIQVNDAIALANKVLNAL